MKQFDFSVNWFMPNKTIEIRATKLHTALYKLGGMIEAYEKRMKPYKPQGLIIRLN